jgi:hypothetical protein
VQRSLLGIVVEAALVPLPRTWSHTFEPSSPQLPLPHVHPPPAETLRPSYFSLKGNLAVLFCGKVPTDMSYSTYRISSPIIAYYYTQLVGDAKVPPTLLAASGFSGFAVIGQSLRGTVETASYFR